VLDFPDIDPVAIVIGPVAIRWYGLAYIVGIGAGWWLGRRRAARRCRKSLQKVCKPSARRNYRLGVVTMSSRQAKSNRRRRERRKAAGLCVACGEKWASPGKTKCVGCAEKHRLAMRAWRDAAK